MSKSTFRMNPGWEKQLERAIRPALRGIANDYQRMFDSLGRRYQGRPVSEIKPVLTREVRRLGGTLSEAELTEYATLISQGISVKTRLK